ncbi:hypothetical protein DH2020_048047 [Rehmannia glutinosa]|uniref:Leucine-rich repeat-containing N-terminal plant-type domain-containing protein n=1 Tax=Rehmannia glutinosa TaxID=99300 RepID=A0ABR0U7J4_REHGL
MRFQMFASTLLILLFFSNSNFGINFTIVTGQSEKDLLLELKNHLIYDSSLSTKLVQWNETTGYCQWSGVKCDNKSRVSSLDLSSESISGGINDSSSLFRFVHLQSLNLAQNSFDSIELPLGFGKLAELRYLNLSNSGFTGQIPLDFSDLTRLVVLDLSSRFYSSLNLENPNLEKLIHNFTRLRELYLDGVNISAKGYDWCNAISSSLPNLRVLSLSNSYLTGSFNSSLLKLHSLSIIRLDGNTFSAPFPVFFADFPNLRVLTLSSCDLFGMVPEKLFQIKSLQTIDLSNNRELEGSLPHEFPLNGSLQNLLLSYTNFSGYVSESIGSLRMLSNFDLRACVFSGQIPSSIKNLTHLVYLDLSVNQFLGSVPSFALLKYLTVLNLRRNNLTGRVPNSLWEGLENLNFLDLSENSLEGEIPASLFVLPSLKVLYLSNNNFYGSIGDSRSSSSPLEVLDLRVNNFEGPIPRFLFELQNLSSLSLSSNKFSGSIELTDFQKLTNLVNLDLSYNNLSVHVREKVSLSSLFPRLGTLLLASCKLRKVPLLTNQSSLMMLDLSDNQIDGEIPNWIWEAGSGYLRFVNLSHNQFNRFDLRRPVYFDLLDLSSNNFSSSLPANIGNFLKPIVFLSIANNKITGTIPPSLCNPSRLQTLDLSNNSLHGKIPSCLLQSTHIRVLNLGGNNLSGDIPDAFPIGCGLESLDFSWNVLQGNFPKSLTRCTEIEVLNLSHNVLSGRIPASIGNIQKLESLDLSFNGLSGEIPKQTFPESSFLGNEGLCGSPLNKTCSGVISNKFYGLVGS